MTLNIYLNMKGDALKILVTGINGQVGWEVQQRGLRQGHDIVGCSRDVLDITDRQSVLSKIQDTVPDLVINCAAFTAVDKAESEEDKAYAVNRDGAAWLAEGCAAQKIPLIHMSTDYVFDGSASQPYKETDSVNPIGVYGKSKEAGEQEVRKRLPDHLIIRTSWVFGVHGHNFVKTMLRLAGERDELKVVDDQLGCPTFAGDLADGLLKIAERVREGGEIQWGTYHCCGATKVTWHEFASLIVEMARNTLPLQVKRVLAIPTI